MRRPWRRSGERAPEGQSTGETEAVAPDAADSTAVDSPAADPEAADPAAAYPPRADMGTADPQAVEPPVTDTGAAETDPFAADRPAAGRLVGMSAPEPTPIIPVSESSFGRPPGTALPTEGAADAEEVSPRPEVMAGAAFAGGLAVAMLIRRALN